MSMLKTLAGLKIGRSAFVRGLLICVVLSPLVAMPQNSNLPGVLTRVEDGWVDVSLAILEHQSVEHEGVKVGDALVIGGTWDGETVRMNVGIPSDWEEAKMTPPPPMKSWSTLVSFLRAGTSSDRFVRALARQYQIPDEGLRAKEEAVFDALSLFEDPRPIGAKPVRLKLFLTQGGRLSHGEVYLTIDLQNKLVKLHEKDPEYRMSIIEALSDRP